jgi:hypothetical protein
MDPLGPLLGDNFSFTPNQFPTISIIERSTFKKKKKSNIKDVTYSSLENTQPIIERSTFYAELGT